MNHRCEDNNEIQLHVLEPSKYIIHEIILLILRILLIVDY